MLVRTKSRGMSLEDKIYKICLIRSRLNIQEIRGNKAVE